MHTIKYCKTVPDFAFSAVAHEYENLLWKIFEYSGTAVHQEVHKDDRPTSIASNQ